MISIPASQILFFIFATSALSIVSAKDIEKGAPDDINQNCERVGRTKTVNCDPCAGNQATDNIRIVCIPVKGSKASKDCFICPPPPPPKKFIVSKALQGEFALKYADCFYEPGDYNYNVVIGPASFNDVISGCEVTKKMGDSYKLTCWSEGEGPFKSTIRIKKSKSGLVINGKKYFRCPE